MVGYRQDRDRRGCYCPLQPALVETDALRRPGATTCATIGATTGATTDATTCATIGATTWCYNLVLQLGATTGATEQCLFYLLLLLIVLTRNCL